MFKKCKEVIASNFLLIVSSVMLTSCASWNEEFEGEVVRAYPNASIHKISKMTDKGIIKEADDDLVLSGDFAAKLKVFKDGNISRGVEDVRRMYVMTYEDASGNLHAAHHLYLVVKPAEWQVGVSRPGDYLEVAATTTQMFQTARGKR